MIKKVRILIAIVIVIVFGYIAWSSFSQQMTPYVGFRQARASARTVQVIGLLVDGHSEIDPTTGALKFSLLEQETNDRMEVIYTGGPKPGNFEQADKIVAIGKFENGVFHSSQLLVKCPSKYQGMENDGDKDKGV
ncbi:MAG: cytochrome C biogenesis protein [candidate division Zixibacteria bacterium CG_4_9_14_3_um_filter_46_8]|nr:MAG: cytochrome C biogenesis protein [candidate division Zixibacteria bacterium CG_4_9_14_3_um_filter_46_8]